jgi:CRISPR/Cas system-associated endoribonuclease Cas2
MAFKKKIWKNSEKLETSTATTTHIFQSLIKMLASVDPVTLQRTRDKFLKKHNPNYKKTNRYFKENFNELSLINGYKKTILHGFNRSKITMPINSTKQLLNFVNTLEILKPTISTSNTLLNEQFICSKNPVLSINTLINDLTLKLINKLSINISFILSNNSKVLLSNKNTISISKNRNFYIINSILHYKDTESVLKNMLTQSFFFKKSNLKNTIWLIQNLNKSYYAYPHMTISKVKKNPSYFYCFSLFSSKRTSTFFSLSQFNFFKTILSNLDNFDFLIHEQLAHQSNFIYNLFLPNINSHIKSNNSNNLSTLFFSIFTFYINNSSSKFIPSLKLPKISMKKIIFAYYNVTEYSTNFFKSNLGSRTFDKVAQLTSLLSISPSNRSKKLLKYIDFLKSDKITFKFFNSTTLNKIEHILKDIYNYHIIKDSHMKTNIKDRYKKIKSFNIKIKKYNIFVTKILNNRALKKSNIQLLSILMFMKKSIFLLRLNNKKTSWLKYQLTKLTKINLDSVTISRLIFRKKKQQYFKILYKLWKNKKTTTKKTSEKRSLLNQIVNQSSKSKFNISKSNDYSFFYLIFLEQNALLRLFRNFLIKNGLKKKANRWLIEIFIFIKQNYKICPIRTLRFLILRHFKASLIKERKLKKKQIYIPKRLSIKKQLFYMVFFFFKEVDDFSLNFKDQFSYKSLDNSKNRSVYLINNYIKYSMNLGTLNPILLKKNLLLEEKIYSLKHFIKTSIRRRNNKFKHKKRYSFYKGHPSFNL